MTDLSPETTDETTHHSPHETPGTWLTDDEQRSWRAYLAATRLINDVLDEDVRVHGLQLGEYEILAVLSETEGQHVRMSTLADSVVQSRSRLTHTASRLEKRGLVRRRPAEDDGRGVELWLTEAGRELLDSVAPLHVASVRHHLIDHLGADGFRRLGDAMGQIRDSIMSERTPGGPSRTT